MNKKFGVLVAAAVVLGVAADGSAYAQTCPTDVPVTQCVFQTLLNTRLGNALLSLNATGELVVSGIGSTGQDGVSITFLDPARTAHEDWEEFARTEVKRFCDRAGGGDLCTTGALFEATGVLRTGQRIVVTHTQTADAPNSQEIQISPAFAPIGASTFRIRVFNGGVPPAVVDVPGQSLAITVDEFPTGYSFTNRDYGVTWDAPRNITVPGAGTVVGDELRLEPENPSVPMGRLQRLELQAADIASLARGAGSFTIIQEFLFRPARVVPALKGVGLLALVLALMVSGFYLVRRRTPGLQHGLRELESEHDARSEG